MHSKAIILRWLIFKIITPWYSNRMSMNLLLNFCLDIIVTNTSCHSGICPCTVLERALLSASCILSIWQVYCKFDFLHSSLTYPVFYTESITHNLDLTSPSSNSKARLFLPMYTTRSKYRHLYISF